MKRLENMLSILRSKGWQITESDTKTLTAYVGVKVNTTMEIAFVDKDDHTIKRKDDNEKISAIKIKSVKVDKKTSMPRKGDMLNDLIALTKNRIDLIYADEPEDDFEKESLLQLGFEIIMKDVNTEKYLKLYCQAKTFGACKPEKETELLHGFVDKISEFGSTYGDILDKKYKTVISQEVFSDKDLDFLIMYLSIIKERYAIDNEDYGGIYEEELESLNTIIEMLESYL